MTTEEFLQYFREYMVKRYKLTKSYPLLSMGNGLESDKGFVFRKPNMPKVV